MSHTNTTTNYSLPLFIGSDTPAWLTDFNGAMTDIDTAINSVNIKAESASQIASNVNGQIDNINSSIVNINNTDVSLQTQINTINSALSFKSLATNIYNGASGIANIFSNGSNIIGIKCTIQSGSVNRVLVNNTPYCYLFTTTSNIFNLPTATYNSSTGYTGTTFWCGTGTAVANNVLARAILTALYYNNQTYFLGINTFDGIYDFNTINLLTGTFINSPT